LLQEQADPVQGLVIQQQLAPSSFPKFSLLPAELRLQTWRGSFPAPRSLDISQAFIRMRERPLKIDTSTLATLHVNQESRGETLRYYRVALIPQPYRRVVWKVRKWGGHYQWQEPKQTAHPRVCFSPTRDFFYMEDPHCLPRLRNLTCIDGLSIFHNITELVLSNVCWINCERCLEPIQRFDSLEKLTLAISISRWETDGLWWNPDNLEWMSRAEFFRRLNEYAAELRGKDPSRPKLEISVWPNSGVHPSMWIKGREHSG
jgi:hypothetical protein